MGIAFERRGGLVADYRALRPHLDAIRFDGDNVNDVAEFLGIDWPDEYEPADQIVIELPDGDHPVGIGDYITRTDTEGNFWPCAGRIFERLYEAVVPE
jgi:hypothetical protein